MRINKIEKPIHEIVDMAIKFGIAKIMDKDIMVPYIMSKPGCGKTAILTKKLMEANYGILSCHIAFTSIEELTGIPQFEVVNIDGHEFKGTVWTVPDLITNLYKVAQNHQYTCLFIDDFHLASQGIATLGFEMFINLAIKGFKFPDNTFIILAGNDSAKAAAKTLSSGIANRCSIFPTFSDFDYWKNNYALPQSLYKPGVAWLSIPTSSQYFHEDEMVNEPWASPRSWGSLLKIINMMNQAKTISEDMIRYLAISHVGERAGNEFATWHEIFSKIDTKRAFAGDINVPHDLSSMFAYSTACCIELFNRLEAAKGNSKIVNETIYQFGKIICTVSQNGAELAVSAFKMTVDFSISNGHRNLYRKLMTSIKQIDQSIHDACRSVILDL